MSINGAQSTIMVPQRLMLDRVRPDIAPKIWDALNSEFKRADQEAAEVVAKLNRANALIAELEKKLNAAEKKITAVLGEEEAFL